MRAPGVRRMAVIAALALLPAGCATGPGYGGPGYGYAGYDGGFNGDLGVGYYGGYGGGYGFWRHGYDVGPGRFHDGDFDGRGRHFDRDRMPSLPGGHRGGFGGHADGGHFGGGGGHSGGGHSGGGGGHR